MEKYDVIIVGGGASGLSCAASLSANKNIKVLVLDGAERAGKKLAATGNGQGNIGNDDMDISHYRGGNRPLIERIISAGEGESAFFKIFGTLPQIRGNYGRLYPASKQASALTDILLRRLEKGGVKLKLSKQVVDISRGFLVACEGGDRFAADFVVLATGGKAQKQFNTDGSAYRLAEKFGHTITPLYPSIVQLKTDTTHTKTLKGIRAQCAVTAIPDGGEERSFTGDVIFTEYGVSGNAIFYLSPAFSKAGGTISLDFLPEFDEKSLVQAINSRIAEGVDAPDLLAGIVHNQIARAVIKRAGGDASRIVKTLKNFTLEVKGTLGFDYAQVTHGGVDMRDISDNLESKLAKNLYFAGEILDVDGDCGGYNLYWAFTSAIAVAEDILKKYEKA